MNILAISHAWLVRTRFGPLLKATSTLRSWVGRWKNRKVRRGALKAYFSTADSPIARLPIGLISALCKSGNITVQKRISLEADAPGGSGRAGALPISSKPALASCARSRDPHGPKPASGFGGVGPGQSEMRRRCGAIEHAPMEMRSRSNRTAGSLVSGRRTDSPVCILRQIGISHPGTRIRRRHGNRGDQLP